MKLVSSDKSVNIILELHKIYDEYRKYRPRFLDEPDDDNNTNNMKKNIRQLQK